MAPRRPYRLDSEPLGRGGFGVVFRAEHRLTGEVVALKKALPGAIALRRMRREIEVQSTLSHEHIMPILDADGQGRWFTMPLGSDTFARRFHNHPATDLELARILHAVARGLQYAHHRGHIHRDVTPGNILQIDHNGPLRWVVADWGLVQRPEGQESLPLTLTGQVLGTRAFAPPELSTTPHGVGPEVDVYYLGALAAWALTGIEPSPHHMPVPERDEWAELVTASTRRDPAARPQSMIEMLATLHELRDQFEAEEQRLRASQGDLFTLTPCGACGTHVAGMRCPKCGAYYATYN